MVRRRRRRRGGERTSPACWEKVSHEESSKDQRKGKTKRSETNVVWVFHTGAFKLCSICKIAAVVAFQGLSMKSRKCLFLVIVIVSFLTADASVIVSNATTESETHTAPPPTPFLTALANQIANVFSSSSSSSDHNKEQVMIPASSQESSSDTSAAASMVEAAPNPSLSTATDASPSLSSNAVPIPADANAPLTSPRSIRVEASPSKSLTLKEYDRVKYGSSGFEFPYPSWFMIAVLLLVSFAPARRFMLWSLGHAPLDVWWLRIKKLRRR